MSNSDSVALLVIAFFGMLAFFAWLLILLLIGGGLWWYKSSCVSFMQSIDFSMLWRPLTPSIEPSKVPLVEKPLTSTVVKSVRNELQTDKINNETVECLKSLEVDFSDFNKINNNANHVVSSGKDFNQVVEKSTEAVFSDEYYLKLKEEIMSSIKEMKTSTAKLNTTHQDLVPKWIIDEIAQELDFKFLISACVGTTIVKGRTTYYLYVKNLELMRQQSLAEIIKNAQIEEYPLIRFENFQNNVLSFFLQFELLNNKFKPELGVVNQIPFVDLKLFSGEGKVLKVDYAQLCDNNYCQDLFKKVSETSEYCEEQKSSN